jgi:hypothetical protein
MSRTLEKRLEKLEAKIAQRQADRLKATQKSTWHLIRVAIGYYLGEPKPDEEPYEAIDRGLGYEDSCMMVRARRDYNDAPERWRQAKRRLFAQFGVDLDGNRKGFEDALKRMEVGLSESFREALREQRRLTGC